MSDAELEDAETILYLGMANASRNARNTVGKAVATLRTDGHQAQADELLSVVGSWLDKLALVFDGMAKQ